MDYREIENKVYSIFKNEIIKIFKKDFSRRIAFTKSMDNIQTFLLSKKNDSYINKNEKLLHDIIYKIHFRSDYYKNEVALNSIISNEIKQSFGEIHNKLLDSQNNTIHVEFEKFIYELITYDCIRRIIIRVDLNKELYELFYENNDYRGFSLDNYDGHVVNSLLYKKTYAKFYPKKPIPTATKVEDFNGITYKIQIPTKRVNSKLSDSLPSFTDDERCMILHLCLNDKHQIPLTEKVKLISLMGTLDNLSALTEPSNTNVIYSKISKGIDRNGSQETMRKILQNIIDNIGIFELNKTKETLMHLKNKLKQ